MSNLLSLLLHDVYVMHPSESGFAGAAADKYKLSVTEFDRQIAGLWVVRKDTPVLVTQPLPEAGVPFAITVDDGGASYYTRIADRLEAIGWRGHCFVTTGAIGLPGFLSGAQIRKLHARGHVIGSHSASHPLRFSACTREEMLREWRESRAVLSDLVGEDVVAASVPGGAYSARVAETAYEAGYRFLFNSEPETRAARVHGCTVLGRFTIRAGCKANFAARLGRLDATARATEWFLWKSKQHVKSLFHFTGLLRQSRMVDR